MKKKITLLILSLTSIVGFGQGLDFSVRDSIVSQKSVVYYECDSTWDIPGKLKINNPNRTIRIYNQERIVSEFLFKNDTIHAKYFYLSGAIKRTVMHQWLNGRNLWVWEENHYENGQLESKYNPSFDSLQHLKVYYPNGTLKREMMYHKSGYFSFLKEYNPNGSLSISEDLGSFDINIPWGSNRISRTEYDVLGNPKIKITFENNLPVDTTSFDLKNNQEALKSYTEIDFWKYEDYTVIEYLNDKVLIVSKNEVFHYALVYNFGTKEEYTIYCNGRIKRKKWLTKPETN